MRCMTPGVSHEALVEQICRLCERVDRIEVALPARQQSALSNAGYLPEPTAAPEKSANDGPSAALWESIDHNLKRIADHLAPPPSEIIGTREVAALLGCEQPNVTCLVRSGKIPSSCIVPGSGHGTYWRFYRTQIEKWRQTRR